VRSNIYNKDIYFVASVGNFYFVIFIGVRIIKEISGWVASGTLCITGAKVL
jgi:hypothetical protein